MKRLPSANTASIGVTRTKLAVEEALGWLFREQPSDDYGIDAHVEVVDDEHVLGHLLALQIKSGSSQFNEPGPDGWWFRPSPAHVNYWTNHSLPVVVVLCDSETRCCYWELVNSTTLVSAGQGWKVLVPKAHVLDGSATEALSEAAAGDPYVLRIRELRLSRPWIERLTAGERLVIDIEEWINKSSGRGSITLGVDNEDGNNPVPLASWGVHLGSSDYATVVPDLFPWATVELHEETYDNADRDERDEWSSVRPRPGLRPYANAGGEVDYWRLELSLNELGRAFMILDEYAMRPGRILTAEES
jgi:Domain of unknown function (DUF4365)